ncbi:HIRAN domain-containing protein [Zhihengliuella alba]
MEKFELVRCSARAEVVGESYHQRGVLGALMQKPTREDWVSEDVEADLVPEPSNPKDPLAVSVRVRGHIVGYLDREAARELAPELHRLAASGYRATTRGSIFAQYRDGYDSSQKATLHSQVHVQLPAAGNVLPVNQGSLDGVVVLPRGGSLQVTGEEHHFEHLFDYVTERGEAPVILTLHRIERPAKSGPARELAEVRLDGERIGELTAASSKHFLPTIDRIEADGWSLGVWGVVVGNELSAEAKVLGAKAAELPGSWLTTPTKAPILVPPAASYDVPEPEPAAGRGEAGLRPGQKAPNQDEKAPAAARRPLPGERDAADPTARAVQVGKKIVHVTDRERRTSPTMHRVSGVVILVLAIGIGLLLGLIPGVGPLLTIGCIVVGIVVLIQSRRMARAVEVDALELRPEA